MRAIARGRHLPAFDAFQRATGRDVPTIINPEMETPPAWSARTGQKESHCASHTYAPPRPRASA